MIKAGYKWAALFAFLLLSVSHKLYAEQAIMAVASNFTQPMQQLKNVFEQTSRHKIKLSFASSGKLYAQITQGAPYAAFFSADQSKPIALENSGLAVANSRFSYATGQLVLWSAQNNLNLSPDRLDLTAFPKIAVANPKLAPYGAAAIETIANLQAPPSVKKSLVYGENIAQTYQYVFTQNAQIGFIAASQFKQHKTGSFWLIPQTYHSAILQDAILLKQAANNQAALAFLNFVKSEQAKQIIRRFGYKTDASS